ncbi:MAG: hypothetical protein ACTSWL_06520 [Promethearchaeota archaeon]
MPTHRGYRSLYFKIAQNNSIFSFYEKSLGDLATQYMEDRNSLTDAERERLIHEANYQWRQIMQNNLPVDDSVLREIDKRFEIPLKDGSSIIL